MASLPSATSVQSSARTTRCFYSACPNRETLNQKVSSCGRCLFGTYCGKECQVADLKRHRVECARHLALLVCKKIEQLVAKQTKDVVAHITDIKHELPFLVVSSNDFLQSTARRETLERRYAPLQQQMREKMTINREGKKKVLQEIEEMKDLLQKLPFVMKALSPEEQAKMLQLKDNMMQFIADDYEALEKMDSNYSVLVEAQAQHEAKLSSSTSRTSTRTRRY